MVDRKNKRIADIGACPRGRMTYTFLALAVIVMAVGWIVWGFLTPLLMDDLIFANHYRDISGRPLPVLRYMANMWLTVNGRFGDMTNCVWLGIIPRPITAVLCGLSVVLTLWGCLKLTGLTRKDMLTLSMVLFFLIAVLPWWDMNLFVCDFNYVWGTALLCPVLLLLLNNKLKSKAWFLILPLVSIIVAIHEAQGLPIAVGLGVYMWLNRSRIIWNKVQKWWCAAIFAGGVICITSPASYGRLGWNLPPQYPWYGMLVFVLPIVCIFVLRCVWLMYKGRLKELISTQWTIFAVASLLSACFTMIGGVGGRGGWYAEVFAIIALGIDFKRSHDPREATRSSRTWAKVLSLMCIAAAGAQVYIIINAAMVRRTLLIEYMSYPESEKTKTDMKVLESEWFEAAMPLVMNEPMEFNSFYYAPSPLAEGEKNPALPIVEL